MDNVDTLSDADPGSRHPALPCHRAEAPFHGDAAPLEPLTAAAFLDALCDHAFVAIALDSGRVSCSASAAALLGSMPGRIALGASGNAWEPMAPLSVTKGQVARAMSGEQVAISRMHRRPDGSEVPVVGSLSLSTGPSPMLMLSLRDASADRLAKDRLQGLFGLGEALQDAGDTQQALDAAADCLRRFCGVAEAGYDLLEGDAFYRPELRPSNRAWPDRANPVVKAQGAVLKRVSERKWASIPDVREDARTREIAEGLERAGIRSMLNQRCHFWDRPHGIVYLHHPEPIAHDRAMTDFIDAVGDRVEAALARLEERHRQEAVNFEIAHRLKNFSTMVLAIANYGLRGLGSPAAAAVLDRLAALDRAQDVLLRGEMAEAPLMEVATGVLAALHGAERFRLAGPDVVLGSKTAFRVALLLHELATNAAKHGALSTPAGSVSVAWRLEAGAAHGVLALEWKEEGGPPVRAPERRGFGMRLLRSFIPDPADAVLDFAPGGLRIACRIAADELAS